MKRSDATGRFEDETNNAKIQQTLAGATERITDRNEKRDGSRKENKMAIQLEMPGYSTRMMYPMTLHPPRSNVHWA